MNDRCAIVYPAVTNIPQLSQVLISKDTQKDRECRRFYYINYIIINEVLRKI